MSLKDPAENMSSSNVNAKILNLRKKLNAQPDNVLILFDLYRCYVINSDTVKKIECLEKISELTPDDPYPLQQLADIYANELHDMDKAHNYQNRANRFSRFL